MQRIAVVVLAFAVLATLERDASKAAETKRPPTSGQQPALESVSNLPAGIYDVQLLPPSLSSGEVRLPAIIDSVPPGGRSTKTFVLPRLQSVWAMLIGDSTARYAFRSPSGNLYVPGETRDSSGFETFGTGEFTGFTLQKPEPGQWTVTTQSLTSKPIVYAIVVSSNDSSAESANLEVMRRDSNPKYSHPPVQPGDPIYVRAFVVKDGRPVPGVNWKIDVMPHSSIDEARARVITIPVADDGKHADGAAGDGIFVGAFVAEGPNQLYLVSGRARTQSGVDYLVTEDLEVEAKNDLLIVGEISVSPDHPRVGSPVTMTVTVKSDGTVDNQGVGLELSRVGGSYASSEFKESRQTFDLRAGESRRISTKWTPSAPGDYELQLTLDLFIEPYWSDHKNNWRRTIVKVR